MEFHFSSDCYCPVEPLEGRWRSLKVIEGQWIFDFYDFSPEKLLILGVPVVVNCGTPQGALSIDFPYVSISPVEYRLWCCKILVRALPWQPRQSTASTRLISKSSFFWIDIDANLDVIICWITTSSYLKIWKDNFVDTIVIYVDDWWRIISWISWVNIRNLMELTFDLCRWHWI